MDPLALVLIVTLTTNATLHAYWTFGGVWPGTDTVTLAYHVVGTPGRTPMHFWFWLPVTLAFYAAAGVVWFGQRPVTNHLEALIAYGGYLTLIQVFGLRGLAPYVSDVFGYAKGTAFYTLNRRYYAPYCLTTAACLILDFPPGLERFIP